MPRVEGLSEALWQLLAVKVPDGEELPEVLAEAGAEGGARAVALVVALWQSVCEAEGESSGPLRALAEAGWEGWPA